MISLSAHIYNTQTHRSQTAYRFIHNNCVGTKSPIEMILPLNCSEQQENITLSLFPSNKIRCWIRSAIFFLSLSMQKVHLTVKKTLTRNRLLNKSICVSCRQIDLQDILLLNSFLYNTDVLLFNIVWALYNMLNPYTSLIKRWPWIQSVETLCPFWSH